MTMAEFQKVINEWVRMCMSYDGCLDCEIQKTKNLADNIRTCAIWVKNNPEAAERIIAEWSKNHPIVTNRLKFKEIFDPVVISLKFI